MNHAEKVEKIVKRVRQALLSYGMQGVQLEDILQWFRKLSMKKLSREG